MLLQALMIIGTTLVLAGTILLGSLASAKSSFQALVARKADGASADGTARFVAWAQDVMAQNAAVGGNAWPRGLATPIREPICDPSPASSLAPCPLLATISWTVTGTSDPSEPAPYWSDRSTIDNPSINLNEQRLSVTLSVTISNQDLLHPAVYAVHAKTITARTFNAPPYVVITDIADLASHSAALTDSEGDTGGFADARTLNVIPLNSPDPALPGSFSRTVVQASISCLNFPGASDTNPFATSYTTHMKTVRSYGNLDWHFEAPCTPKYVINENLPYDGWEAPSKPQFIEQVSGSRFWQKNHHDSFSPFLH